MAKLYGKQKRKLYHRYMYTISKYGRRKLCDVYNSFSKEKLDAEVQILNDETNYNGFDYTILGYNSQHFSCAYVYVDSEKMYLVYHAKSNRYVVDITNYIMQDFCDYIDNIVSCVDKTIHISFLSIGFIYDTLKSVGYYNR